MIPRSLARLDYDERTGRHKPPTVRIPGNMPLRKVAAIVGPKMASNPDINLKFPTRA